MNFQAVTYANDHLEELRRDAANRRMSDELPRITLRQRLASLAGTLRSTFAAPVATGSVTPATH